MNYLAHIFLSGNDSSLQIGNFIGDFVKGKSYLNYPAKIQEGILLHRFIDDYTDRHPVVLEAKKMLQKPFGRYAAILLDMYYDHFLAHDFLHYSNMPLRRFSRHFYWAMLRHYRSLPPRVRGFAWHFISSNRLCKYSSLQGLQQSLEIMIHYKPLNLDADEIIRFLTDNYTVLQENFHSFFPDLLEQMSSKINDAGITLYGDSFARN